MARWSEMSIFVESKELYGLLLDIINQTSLINCCFEKYSMQFLNLYCELAEFYILQFICYVIYVVEGKYFSRYRIISFISLTHNG